MQGGINFVELIELLNSRVFLWAGTSNGLGRRGQSHFEHYEDIGSVRVIRVPQRSLLEANPMRTLEVTFCNSGSARHQNGQSVPRGRDTFQPAGQAIGQPADVKELTFLDAVALPADTTWSQTPSGPWQALCGDS